MTTQNLPPEKATERTLYVVATVHLDTQWRWTVQDTVREFLPDTLERNFALFERYPFFVLSFEGAFRYMLAREYYPAEFERLKDQVRRGRWRVAGNMLDAPDVNAVSPESLIRHILYGRRWFAEVLGAESVDIFLPDCFGFGQALPSVAAHCGLTGFSSQKFGKWGAPARLPFDVGLWEGPDGASIYAALRPEGYGEGLEEDLSRADRWRERIDVQAKSSGAPVALMYVGVGDRGGALDQASMHHLAASVAGEGPVRVIQDGSDRIFRDLAAKAASGPDATGPGLATHRGELLLPTHGTGCWTSQAPMKRWNRRAEQLADAAERAAVVADWLGAGAYPAERLRQAWIRFLWHQQHDDLTGTSIPEAYRFSWNDQLIALNQFADVLTTAVDGVAAGLDTRGEGEPLVVYNPLSIRRQDLVSARLEHTGASPAALRIYDGDGEEVPSQVVDRGPGHLRVVFLADLPPVGFRVFHARPAASPCTMETGLQISAGRLENRRYRVEIDRFGDLARVHDKQEHFDLLSRPAGLELLLDGSSRWPAWEIRYRDVASPAAGRVAGPARVEVVEEGPARVVLEVRRSALGSGFAQRYVLAAGRAGERLEIRNRVDWRTRGRLLKAVFPLNLAHPTATYDLGLGVIERGNNEPVRYEVPAQQWADLGSPDEGYGVSVLNDCRYGWDKPDDSTLRLSLLRSPRVIRKFRHQGVQDHGTHRFTYALFGHPGAWRDAGTVWQAARLNQPLMAFKTREHPGPLGRELSFLGVDDDAVAVRALKRAESGDGIAVRLQELGGRARRSFALTLPTPIVSATALTGAEEPLGDARVTGGRLEGELGPFAPATFSLRPGPASHPLERPELRPLALPYDLEATSFHGEPRTGDLDGRGHTLPGELFPTTLESGGAPFELGPREPGSANAVVCASGTLDLPPGDWRRMYLLAAATGDGPVRALFGCGSRDVELRIQRYTGTIGRFKGWRRRGALAARLYRTKLTWGRPDDGFILRDPIAWLSSHRHDARGRDEPYVFCYLFRYRLTLPEGTSSIALPEAREVAIFAATVAGPVSAPGDSRPVSVLYD